MSVCSGHYLDELAEAIGRIDRSELYAVAHLLQDAYATRRQVFTLGNGASDSDGWWCGTPGTSRSSRPPSPRPSQRATRRVRKQLDGERALRSLVESAALAPSSHNTQPWVFRFADDRLELLADRTRALPANDPHDRELTISCGAAWLNVRVAAQHAGTGLHVTLLPEGEESDLLARATLAAGRPEPGLPAFDAVARAGPTGGTSPPARCRPRCSMRWAARQPPRARNST
jgi:hypothetical protein